MIFAITLVLLQLLLPAAAWEYNVHTGFNYGAFWGTPDKPKLKGDYTKAFKTAYSSLNTSVAFDTARLFTCRQPGTTDTPIEAFDAAVDTHTYLLLGFYLSETKRSAQTPGQTYESNADMLKYELRALEKALGKHGDQLADLIIGLSVGNEDMEQWYSNHATTGVPEGVIAANLATVRNAVLGSALDESFPNIRKYMTNKPIGHTDTAPHAAKAKNVNFVGMNAYPYWSEDPPASAKASYFGSLNGVKNEMPGKAIWLTEVGWPFSDTISQVSAQGTANKENLQKYWDEIGCSVFGKYTTFWFELISDSLPDQPDWAIIDASKNDYAPRIDVSCGIGRKAWAPHRRDITSSNSTVSAVMVARTIEATQAASSPTAIPSLSHNIYTGFSYGAFWSESKPKLYKDFVRQFTLARNLPDVPVPFTSARLYQAAQWNSPTEPSEAFQAAIETNTTLLIGLWLPIDKEIEALDAAFKKYGQKLADLVIGISVGSEDIYRGSDECAQVEGKACSMAATADEVMANITYVKDEFHKRGWDKLFKALPPIGHTDTARNAFLANADFVGANIFPFWHQDPIDKAWNSFEESLQGIKEHAGNVPVWITETGWPSSGNDKAASIDNMQKYWSTVGCALVGKYTTFWFELEKDTHDLGDLDWGLIDIPSQKPKIANLSCPGLPGPPSPSSPIGSPTSTTTMRTSAALNTSTFVALPSTAVTEGYMSIQTDNLPASATPSTLVSHNGASQSVVGSGSTVHVTITSTIIMQPSSGPEAPPSSLEDIVTVTSFSIVNVTVDTTLSSPTPSLPAETSLLTATSRPAVLVTEPTGCITITKDANGQPVTISNAPINGKCLVPPYLPSLPTAPAAVTDASPTRCLVVVTDPIGKLITIPTDIPGKCATPVPTPAVVQDTATTSRPTVYVTEATGCITVSKGVNGKMVTVESNPPVEGQCATPTAPVTPVLTKGKTTVYLTPS
ncbi:uncharacterized protein N0V89_003776 [Didymosphaeria variabile]|uniref:Probable glucan endo-1,3-beta-glucosidase eglC n=1 Tax=Didymosphaeria variabile TaxID=1932322 RepID=A0A9W8XPY2_9PLEO|nr:uncharacterized protein N0V89_003776 [Didymosphaeria variabile]KAJ4355756.1 hypothetical protein N0V89_003776 [Didymosphaeria variabile]